MNLKIIKNPNEKIYNDVTEAVIENNNYCPCKIEKIPENKCPCKEFREQDTEGYCHCERFIKVKIDNENINSPRIAKFEKVSFEQFKEDWLSLFPYSDNDKIYSIWSNIKPPKRATKGSAGYDFYTPFNYNCIIEAKETVIIPTGIRCKMNENYVLQIYPRSSYGFKYGVHLANTVGIIDSDYYYSDNEGHIFIKLINDSLLAQDIAIHQDTTICQGVFIQYGITFDDEAYTIRNGGLGSTSKKKII